MKRIIEAKDIISIIVIIGIFILIALDKITWEVGAPLLSSIVFYYLGYKTGEKLAQRKSEG